MPIATGDFYQLKRETEASLKELRDQINALAEDVKIALNRLDEERSKPLPKKLKSNH